jgi:hypothetical protein
MRNELEENGHDLIKTLPGIFWRGLRRTKIIIVRVGGRPDEIRTDLLPNTSIARYRVTKVLGKMG